MPLLTSVLALSPRLTSCSPRMSSISARNICGCSIHHAGIDGGDIQSGLAPPDGL
jgi:hypothetical protein